MSTKHVQTKEGAGAAWAFVLANMTYIERIAARSRFRRRHVSVEEFRSDLITDIVEHFGVFDPSRGTPEAWVWTRARLQATKTDKAREKAERHDAIEPAMEPPGAVNGFGGHGRLQTYMLVNEVLRMATPMQHAACITVLEDLDGDDVCRALGTTIAGRTWRLNKLGAQLRASDNT
jgi:hypothetical protein